MKDIRSRQFDDIYFSAEDGLAETRHVFLAGNNLPEAWQGRDVFTIAETGFGTGLNFLAAWTLFEKSAGAAQRLHYVSFEKFPLEWGEISRALSPWRTEFGGRMDRLRPLYPLRVPGFHRIMLNEQVMLTLIFDDVNEALPQLDAPGGVDAWFLDGFAPAKNPDMWTEAVFREMARLSREGTSFATFTAAGAVRRGLEASGFAVEKRRGYGRKRDMLAGRFAGKSTAPDQNRPLRIAVVGGGLAGTAAAFVLRRCGLTPVIYEASKSLAAGASGNELGLYNPRLSKQRGAESDFYTASWAQAVRTLAEMQNVRDIGFNPCGSLHLATDEDRRARYEGALANWGWHRSHMHMLDAASASRRAGVALNHPALFLPEAGTVSPAALCGAYAAGTEVRLETPVRRLEKDGRSWKVNGGAFDVVILACGAAVKAFAGLEELPLHTVRGQITAFKTPPALFSLRTNLCYGGYCAPQRGGVSHTGATFQQWLTDTDIRSEDDEENIRRLRDILPGLDTPAVAGSRAALRTSSQDRFPLIGAAPESEGLYISAGHGSHGIISTLGGAHLLADMITGGPRSLPRRTVEALEPERFAKREKKKGRV